MGQQQLLLIALSVIIVGAAVAVGVNMMTEGQQEVKQDMIYQRAQYVAQKWGEMFNKPTTMGGFGGDASNIPSTFTYTTFCSIISVEAVSGRTQITAASNSSGTITVTMIAGDLSGTTLTQTHTGTFLCTTTGEADWNDSNASRVVASTGSGS